jgi:hypothetical protein
MIEGKSGFEIVHGCETDPTSSTAGRKSCHTIPEKVTAPDGYVIDDRSVEFAELVRRGECHIYIDFSDWVEVLPKIIYPRTVTVYADSRSPSKAGTSGHISISLSGDYINIPNLMKQLKISFGCKDIDG